MFYPDQDFRIQAQSTRSEIISIFIDIISAQYPNEEFTERKDPQKYQECFGPPPERPALIVASQERAVRHRR